uniref:Secretagogin, EF-hand calcium binding protein n=1 Tax=Salarias fasciatus TaxID=181472 RepID=A0A672G377_SALFA
VGSIDGEQLESFFHFALQKNNMKLATMMLPEDENFLLFFRTETPLDNSVEFMRIWRNYDSDGSGFISAAELQGFLQDLFLQHGRNVSPEKLEGYTVTMVTKRRLLTPAHHCSLFLTPDHSFSLLITSNQEDRRRDFEKIFSHYDVSKTGELEGPEVDGFVKDMMELVKPSISGTDLDKFRKALMSHCDVNGDGKIQKNELALCLGLKLS